jgi:hypothetical protein
VAVDNSGSKAFDTCRRVTADQARKMSSKKVINEKGQAIKMARVTLLPARGKVAAAAGLSSAAGVFETKTLLKPGDYRLRVEHADYVKFEDQVELIEGGQNNKASFTVRLKSLLKK